MILVIDDKDESEMKQVETSLPVVDLDTKPIDEKVIIEPTAIITVEDNVTTINNSDVNNEGTGKFEHNTISLVLYKLI